MAEKIVRELRAAARFWSGCGDFSEICTKAADTIETLRRELAEARAETERQPRRMPASWRITRIGWRK